VQQFVDQECRLNDYAEGVGGRMGQEVPVVSMQVAADLDRFLALPARETPLILHSHPDPEDSDPLVYREPETSVWERSLIRLLEPVVPESLL